SFVRADCANDLRANDDPVIDPGDSAVVSCNADYSGGLDTTSTGEARVYCHVWAEYIGTDGLKSDLYGPSLEGSYGTYVGDDGAQWTTFLCPVAITGGGNPAAGRYMIDLNDSLFTRGYQVNYYFKAYSFGGGSSCLPEDAETDGRWFEFTCLPTHNSGLLFVDDFHGRGTFEGTVQTYWDPALAAVVPGDAPDRYDVNSPSSLVSNGPGSRAKNYQMVNTYRVVIWDSGNLNSGTITEGTTWSDKSNDAQMLIDWMELSEHKVGLWVMGDGIAYDLDGSPAPSAIALLGTYCGVSLVNDSYFELTGGRTAGGIVNPQVTGVVASIYDGIQYYAFGGCPIINAFDVLEVSGTGAYTLQLPDYNSVQYYIGISNSGTNSAGYAMRTSWIGHSMMYVRNGGLQMPRNELLESTWNYFETETNEDITGETVPGRYALMQNYPNPFNPSTTIRFDLPRKGHVDLKIYNVAGQLVRVLTDQDWDAGHHSIDWNGRNQAGSRVASGVYFYKIEADSFESTKKMVLLR
ncbi:MAG TPA: FlgD immunoglobulin-like domain containing protein, partial [Candidatus Krumholzibacterium sp.]|nr:FlgD immunoglobulin-like domain containing protein [Candidatus Krumholzibacterium sp.]